MLARYMLLTCLSVCHTLVLAQNAKPRSHKQCHDSPGTVVFWCQRSWRNPNEVASNRGTKFRCGRLKSVTFVK